VVADGLTVIVAVDPPLTALDVLPLAPLYH
jgi:hypothetical protein